MNAEITVRDMMNREYVGVSESDDLVETVELLLREEAEAALVLRGSEPVGVLTERDVLALVVEGPAPAEATVADAMTESVPTVTPDTPLSKAADKMSAQDARRLVVSDRGEPLGIITEHDLLASRTPQPEAATPESIVAGTGGTAMAADTQREETDNYQDQSICEGCGTLTGDLASFNGQLLCSDCRDI